MTIRTTNALAEAEAFTVRALLDRAFGSDPEEGFTDHDWDHALGGVHLLGTRDGRIIAHAAVVSRDLEIEGRSWSTGYVEAVATEPEVQGEGHGTEIMALVGEIIKANYQLGALGTGSFHFYERLGWERWTGPMAVRTDSGLRPTPEDEGFLMILRTSATSEVDPTQLITCEWRPGDVW